MGRIAFEFVFATGVAGRISVRTACRIGQVKAGTRVDGFARLRIVVAFAESYSAAAIADAQKTNTGQPLIVFSGRKRRNNKGWRS